MAVAAMVEGLEQVAKLEVRMAQLVAWVHAHVPKLLLDATSQTLHIPVAAAALGAAAFVALAHRLVVVVRMAMRAMVLSRVQVVAVAP